MNVSADKDNNIFNTTLNMDENKILITKMGGCTVSPEKAIINIIERWRINLVPVAQEIGIKRVTLWSKLTNYKNGKFSQEQYDILIDSLTRIAQDIIEACYIAKEKGIVRCERRGGCTISADEMILNVIERWRINLVPVAQEMGISRGLLNNKLKTTHSALFSAEQYESFLVALEKMGKEILGVVKFKF